MSNFFSRLIQFLVSLIGLAFAFFILVSLYYLFIFNGWETDPNTWFKGAENWEPYAEQYWPIVIICSVPALSAFWVFRRFKIPAIGLGISSILAAIFSTNVPGAFDDVGLVIASALAASGCILSVIGYFINRRMNPPINIGGTRDLPD